MAVTLYTKTLATQPNSPQLAGEIDADPTIAPKYVAAEGISWTSPNVLQVWMSDALTVGEEAALDAVIAAHVPITGLDDTNLAPFSYPRPPEVTDDASKGVAVDDWWYDTLNDATYLCTDNTVGAAVWEESGGTEIVQLAKKGIFQVVMSSQSNPYASTSSADWAVLARFYYQGSDDIGPISKVQTVAAVVQGNNTGSLQIYDATNLQVIAQATNIITGPTFVIYDLGTVSNLPTGPAVLEIRGARSAGAASTIGYSSVHMEF